METCAWHYYNHAMIPTTTPTEEVDTNVIRNGTIWEIGGANKPLLARWTSDFDCGFETNWWYVIKDTPFDISLLKAKRRYEINKGIRFFDVRRIDPCDYGEALYRVQVAAFSTYPKTYRPKVDKETFLGSLKTWSEACVFGAFSKETEELAGYAFLSKPRDGWVDFSVLKTIPEYEKLALNAALVAGVLNYYEDFLTSGGIICDGARSISHETNFQDYLEKYFGFRKAYCNLHVEYNPKIRWIIKALFPFRPLLLKLDSFGFIHQINGVLKMEALCREKE